MGRYISEELDACYWGGESDAVYVSMVYVVVGYPDIVLSVDDISEMYVSASVVGVSLAMGWVEDSPVE